MKRTIKILPVVLLALCSIRAEQDIDDFMGFTVLDGTETERELIYKAAHIKPTLRQIAWQEMEYIAFMCYGPNAHTDREWGTGKEDPKLTNPTEFDADQLVSQVKSFGMKAIIFLAKHHDGYCLWPTKTTPHNISQSPWKNGKGDMIKDMAEACRKHGIKLSIYLSPWDMNQQLKGTYNSPVYREIFREQLRELLTQYGEVADVWFDGAHAPGVQGPYDAEKFDWLGYYRMIRTLQPKATISIMGPDVRWCGNEAGHTRTTEWSVMPVKADYSKNVLKVFSKHNSEADLASRAKLKGSRALRWAPAQVNTSIRPGWFYHAAEDSRVKPLDSLFDMYLKSVGGNAQFLLNLPLDGRGKIHHHDIQRMKDLKKMIDATFSRNLLSGAKISASDSLQGHGAATILDADKNSYWTVKEWQEQASLEITLPQPRTFDLVMLQEQISVGQRIEQFAVDAYVDGQWQEIGAATTVGYKKFLMVKKTTADRLRIRITASRVCPTLSNIGLYKLPVLLKAPVISRDSKGMITMQAAQNQPIHYTLDGRTPTRQSKKYTGPFDLSGGGEVKARVFTEDTQNAVSITDPIAYQTFGIAKAGWSLLSVSSENVKQQLTKAVFAFDDNPRTFWHTQWVDGSPGYPHHIAIDLGKEVSMTGFAYLPRQDASIGGVIFTYEFYTSHDGVNWGKPVAAGRFDNIENNPISQNVRFKQPAKGRYIKLVATSGVKGQAYAGAAEIDVLTHE